jgi:hypothetical protein
MNFDKVIFWFTENRKKIGYTLGIINVLCGVNSLATDQPSNGMIQIFIGTVLIFDAWLML